MWREYGRPPPFPDHPLQPAFCPGAEGGNPWNPHPAAPRIGQKLSVEPQLPWGEGWGPPFCNLASIIGLQAEDKRRHLCAPSTRASGFLLFESILTRHPRLLVHLPGPA